MDDLSIIPAADELHHALLLGVALVLSAGLRTRPPRNPRSPPGSASWTDLVAGNRSHVTASSRHDVGMEMAATPWSLRPAAYDDGPTLAAIVAEAARDQGFWPDMTPAEETEWLEGFARWSRESVDGPDTLHVVEVDGEPVGRLRTERDHAVIDGLSRPRITLCGIQLRPAVQGRGIGTAIIRDLQAEAASSQGIVDLGVEHANTHARRLYERLGFVPFASDEQELHLRWRSSAA